MRRLFFGFLLGTSALTLLSGAPAVANPVFSTFVSGGDIAAVEGYNSTIAFNYAGNKFVGSVYFGASNTQLFSTDLTGGNVQKFGTPLPTGGGEVVVAASLGQGGFSAGDVFASGDANIYHYANAGGAPTLFGTLPSGGARQIFFDPGNSFGGDMLVTTNTGAVYRFNSAGVPTFVASVGEDVEGIDIVTTGLHKGDLLVSSEGSGKLRLISPAGVVTDTGVAVPIAESVSFVPSDYDPLDPLQGYYVANFPVDIQFAPVSDFVPYIGDAIVMSEFGSNSSVWDIPYDPITGLFSAAILIGSLPNQAEDGIFVTKQRKDDINPNPVPEPATLAVFGAGLLGLGAVRRRRKAKA